MTLILNDYLAHKTACGFLYFHSSVGSWVIRFVMTHILVFELIFRFAHFFNMYEEQHRMIGSVYGPVGK